jgi:DNA-binding NarL/FixJ family response regulator
MKESFTVFIVDDHILFRDGLKYVIEKLPDFTVTGEANNGKQFLEMLNHDKPDLVLMDISMPVMSGIEASEKAIQLYPDLKIIILSMYEDQQYYNKMISCGVKGFVLKESGKKELENALTEVIHGRNYFSQELLCKIITSFNKNSVIINTHKVLEFTQREVEIIQHLCQGLSNSEIAKKLFLSPKTVEGHKSKLLKKTFTKNTAGLIMFAIKNGIVAI